MIEKIAIIGEGNGGITAAADLKSKGFHIHLYEMPQFKHNLKGVLQNKGIILQDENGEETYSVDLVTTDIEEAVHGVDLVMLTIPGFAIESFAELLAPVMDETQPILLNGASAMGCIRFIKRAKELGINKQFNICETNSLTYGTRVIPDEARVELSLRAKSIFLAAYPKENTMKMTDICSEVYDCFIPAKNVWHAALENGNPEVHPGPSLLNAGRIDYSNGEFYLYKEGITEHTIKVLKAIERERIAIGHAFGFELENAIQSRFRRGYFQNEEEDLQTLLNTSKVFTEIKGPNSVDSRYFTEDISDGLVLWSNLAKVAGIATPGIDAVITLGGIMLEKNFFKEGLTLEKLDFKDLGVDTLIKKT